MYYYFYNYKVETATTKIYLEDWQELTSEEINIYESNNYKCIIKFGNIYKFDNTDLPEINLDELKQNKILELSKICLDFGESIAPNYKFSNCILSKEMEESGENPIYTNWRDQLNEYTTKRIFVRNEFYRIKTLIENSTNIDELLSIFTLDILKYEKES